MSMMDGNMRKTEKFYSEQKSFLENTIFGVFGNNNCSALRLSTFNTHTSLKWDGDMRKTHKFYSERKSFLENTISGRFGYNNSSVSNPTDFNTHTSSK